MKNLLVFLLIILTYIIFDTGNKISIDNLKIENLQTIDTDKWENELVSSLSGLIRIKTVRSNELEACKYIQSILTKYGIESKIYFDPNFPLRANLIAELKSDNPEDGLILMNHLDTVEVNQSEWNFPAFNGNVENGKIYGRGAMDMKSLAIMELYSFIQLKLSGIKLKRNIMFLALSDEETASEKGAKYMIKNHKDLFKGYKFSINEGGLGTKDVAFKGTKIFNLQFAEKGHVWVKLKSKGLSGHGSSPPANYSSKDLLELVNDILKMDNKLTILPQTEAYFSSLSEILPFPNSFLLARINNPIIKLIAGPKLKQNKHLNAMTSNTKTLTQFKTIEAGPNVIVNETEAIIDIRILPKIDSEKYFEKIKKMASLKNISVEPILVDNATTSSLDSKFFKALSSVLKKNVPDSAVAPFLSPGGTDSQYFRRIGIEAYGLLPGLFNSEELEGFHGKNENISIENLKLGTKIIFETLVLMNQ